MKKRDKPGLAVKETASPLDGWIELILGLVTIWVTVEFYKFIYGV